MADDYRTQSSLLSLYADNSSGDISAQDFRDGVVSWQAMPGVVPVSGAHGGGTGTRADRATAVQNAINDATNNGLGLVMVTDDYLNYDASAVTFDNSVRMVREGQVGDVYDVKAYGAAGDNTVDDTAAVNGALSAAESSEGTVWFPVGDFRVTSKISTTTSGVTIQGRSRTHSQLRSDQAIQILEIGDGVSSVFRTVVRDLSILSDGTATGGLKLNGSPRTYLENLIIGRDGTDEINGHLLEIAGASFNVTAINCRFSGSTGDGVEFSGDNNNRITFLGCNFHECDGIGVDVPGNAFASGVSFFGCNFEGNEGGGLDLGEVHGGGAFGCRFENNGNWDVRMDGSAGSGTWCRGYVVSGGFFNGSSRASNDGVLLDRALDCQVNAISSKDHGGSAVHVTATAQRVVVGPIDSQGETEYTDDGGSAISRYADIASIGFTLEHKGSRIGFFDTSPVLQQSALTTADGSTVDATYGTEERDVIQNLVTRQNELEARMQAYGLLP